MPMQKVGVSPAILLRRFCPGAASARKYAQKVGPIESNLLHCEGNRNQAPMSRTNSAMPLVATSGMKVTRGSLSGTGLGSIT